MSKESTSNLNLPEELEGEGAPVFLQRSLQKQPGQRDRSQAPNTGLSRICSRAAEGKDSVSVRDGHGAGAPMAHRLQPWLLVLEGSSLPQQPLPAPHTTQGAQSSHRLARLGHCTGAPARLFRHLLLVFQNLGQEKMLFSYFVSTWLSFLHVKSQWKLLHRNNAIQAS